MTRARFLAAVAFVLGATLLTVLIAWRGYEALWAALVRGGAALAWLLPWYAVVMTVDAVAWAVLLPATQRRERLLFLAVWIGNGVNWLLPVAQIGGDLVRIRIIASAGVRLPVAVSSVLVDKTLQATAIAVTSAVALAALVRHVGDLPIAPVVGAFIALVGSGIYVFYRLQYSGLITRLTAGTTFITRVRLPGIAAKAAAIDRRTRALYASSPTMACAIFWRLLNPLLLSGEVYIAMLCFGMPLSYFECVVLQSLAQAVRSAAFLVPGGLGVQEGGVVLLALALGVPADTGLALALAKRARELVIGVPGLILWQLYESQSWWSRSAGNAARADSGRFSR